MKFVQGLNIVWMFMAFHQPLSGLFEQFDPERHEFSKPYLALINENLLEAV